MALFSKKLGLELILQRLNNGLKRQQQSLTGVANIERAVDELAVELQNVDKGTQILLALKFRELASQGLVLPFEDVEFRNYSQCGEDGILHYIFSLIGTTNKQCVELCAGSGLECVSANLILNHGWFALLVDGDEKNVRKGLEFFSTHADGKVMGPRFLKRWISDNSVNAILKEASFSGEIDLLTIDMDGLDYWVWDAITEINPRVVVVEFMPWLGREPITTARDENFTTEWIPLFENGNQTDKTTEEELPDDLSFFSRWTLHGGASLAAYNKLAKRKGYCLVGANGQGFNAFFIRNDIAQELFPEVSESTCFNENYNEYFKLAWQKLKDHKFETV